MESSDLLRGVFLLILAVSGNFVAETLGCKTRTLLTDNMLVKQIIILSIIYFAIDFTTQHSPPIDTFANTLIIWVAFLMFTKMNETFTALCFLLLLIGYILASQRDYLKNNEKKNKKQINNYKSYIKFVMTLFTILLIVGFVLYFIKQRNEHKKTWNILKFIFGVHECGKL